MTFIWLIVWLCAGHPGFAFQAGSGWAVSLLVCIACDLIGANKQ